MAVPYRTENGGAVSQEQKKATRNYQGRLPYFGIQSRLCSSCAGNFDQRIQAGVGYLLRLRYRFVSAVTCVGVYTRL